MGMKITHVSPERVTGELLVTEHLTNRNGVLHGGALMALRRQPRRHRRHRQPAGDRRLDHHDREQDQFLRRHPGRRCRQGGMHAAASRPHHHGLADPHHPRRRQARRDRDADPIDDDEAGARSSGMDVRAAVAFEAGKPLAVTHVQLEGPQGRRGAGRDQGHRHLPHRRVHAVRQGPGGTVPGDPRPRGRGRRGRCRARASLR